MLSEKVYRALLAAYPSEHRREYEEPMVQLFRDRMRCEGGGFRTPVVWAQTLTDLVRSAFTERMERVEMQAMLITTLRTLLEPRRRWSYLAVLLALLALMGFGLSGFHREANYSYEGGMLQGGRNLDAIVAERAAAFGFTPEEARQDREWYEEYRLQTFRLYSILHAPNSIQLVAQMMVTVGAFFAVSLGVISGRAARSPAPQGTGRDALSRRWWTLAPYFAAPMFLWSLLTAASVGLALLAGLIISSALTLEGPVVENSKWNLSVAVLGMLLAGFMWSAIGVSLGAFIRSVPIAFAVGIAIVVGEISIGSLVDIFQDKIPLPFTIPNLLPTHGAISLVSIDAPKLFHGLVTPLVGHPLHGIHPVAGVVLVVSAWGAAVGIGLRSFGKTRIVECPSA